MIAIIVIVFFIQVNGFRQIFKGDALSMTGILIEELTDEQRGCNTRYGVLLGSTEAV